MPVASLSAEGIVMSRGATAGGYERLELLTASGLLRVMRRPGGVKAGVQPDLFDVCSVRLEARPGGAWFVREYVAQRRFGGLGANYEALVAASCWSRLAVPNAEAVESTAFLFGLTLRALDAWERGVEPSVVRLKALYLFSRDEGLPVKEDWFAGLLGAKRLLAAEVLKMPMDAANGAFDEGAVQTLADGLEKWMCGEHHIVPPRTVK